MKKTHPSLTTSRNDKHKLTNTLTHHIYTDKNLSVYTVYKYDYSCVFFFSGFNLGLINRLGKGWGEGGRGSWTVAPCSPITRKAKQTLSSSQVHDVSLCIVDNHPSGCLGSNIITHLKMIKWKPDKILDFLWLIRLMLQLPWKNKSLTNFLLDFYTSLSLNCIMENIYVCQSW